MNTHHSNQRCQALTLIEVVVVVFLVAVLAAIVWRPMLRSKDHSYIFCINNIKQIGLAFQIWAGDNNGKYPMQVSIADGGAMEPATNGNAAAIFQVMSNELSIPLIVICPQDKNHIPATNFANGNFTGKNVSYFAGLDASKKLPRTILGGDDNFESDGVPVEPGVLSISTNSMYYWSTKRHDRRGYVGFADGSVRQLSNSEFINLIRQTGVATNHLAIP